MKNYSCYYDSASNAAEVIDTSAPEQRPDDCDYELIEHVDSYELHNYDGDRLVLRRDQQTKEQAVILFATMLGLREAARE